MFAWQCLSTSHVHPVSSISVFSSWRVYIWFGSPVMRLGLERVSSFSSKEHYGHHRFDLVVRIFWSNSMILHILFSKDAMEGSSQAEYPRTGQPCFQAYKDYQIQDRYSSAKQSPKLQAVIQVWIPVEIKTFLLCLYASPGIGQDVWNSTSVDDDFQRSVLLFSPPLDFDDLIWKEVKPAHQRCPRLYQQQ